MRVINKKMVVVVLLIIEFTCGYLMYQSSKKNIDLAKVTYEEEIKDSMFAMYVENEDTGEYDEVTNTNTFPEGYILNMDKTGCIDNKGNSISDILTSKDDKVMVKSNKTVFCYLYFDKDNRVYTQVKSDYKNSTGALLLSETESDEYPVYYYNGNITNNNILYANHCWKMVRTTETGGVKLIYNGVPDETEDGTLTCDNTGEETQIGTSKFNPSNNSPAYVGYMYNTIYSGVSKTMSSTIRIFDVLYSPSTYYYGDTVTWDGSKYVLSNSDGSEMTTYVWADNYTNLVGKYTCKSSTSSSCVTVSYVAVADSRNMYHYILSEGKIKDDYKIKLATSITDNGDGTYTLVNPIEVIKADWPITYSNYEHYYYCGDLTSTTCSDMYYGAYTFPSTSIVGLNMSNNYKYGNSFELSETNRKYKLVDTKEFWDWSTSYNQINNNHYTCFNVTGECEEVKYIYETSTSTASYITLSDGEFVEDAINKMLYAEDVNKTDSTIKDYIDTWFEDNIKDVADINNLLYSTYLEDTIWCNNREISDLGGWNPNGGDTTKNMIFINSSSLGCKNKTDQFTLKVESGGTEGYGNNALDYPIGLLVSKETSLANDSASYLNSKTHYQWLLSPRVYNGGAYMERFHSGGSLIDSLVTFARVVRPSISLSNKVEIIGGDGSVELPYQVELSS